MAIRDVTLLRTLVVSLQVVKKVVKKPIKKVVKKVAPKKKVVKKIAPKGGKRGTSKPTASEEFGRIGALAGSAITGYGGGNGAAALSPTVLAGVAAWVFVLFRFVLFYGAFGDADL